MIVGAALFALLAQAAPAATAPAAQPVTKAASQAEVKKSFDAVDLNKDGYVDKAEAQKLIDGAVANEEKRRSNAVSSTFAKLDINKDGSLSRAEFDAISPKGRAPTTNPYITAFDSNKDGRVSLSEVYAKSNANFDAADRDKNGVVTPQEERAFRQAAAAARARARAPK